MANKNRTPMEHCKRNTAIEDITFWYILQLLPSPLQKCVNVVEFTFMALLLLHACATLVPTQRNAETFQCGSLRRSRQKLVANQRVPLFVYNHMFFVPFCCLTITRIADKLPCSSSMRALQWPTLGVLTRWKKTFVNQWSAP